MRRMVARSALAGAAWLVPAVCLAQVPEVELAAVLVVVVDAQSRAPLVGALIGFPELGLYALTDTTGTASLTGVPPGPQRFEVAHFGYETEVLELDLVEGRVASGEIAMAFQPIPIEEIMVQGRSRWSARLQRNGFYERAENGIGYQMDRVAIREYNVMLLSDLLERIPRRSQFRGFIDPAPAVEDVDFTEPLPLECAPGIYVDGTPWTGFVDDLPLDWVEGLEYYTSPVQVPIEYLGGGAFCGLLLIWTG